MSTPSNQHEPLKPADVCLGNFIDCFGMVEMVVSIHEFENGQWYISHKRWNQEDNPLPCDMLSNPYPIPLTQEWKECLKVDKYQFPEWVEYVHEAQNYMRWYANVNLLDIMDWSKMPKIIEIQKCR